MLTAYLIQMACAGAYYGDACHKASEAFAKQSGFERNAGAVEGWSRGRVKQYASIVVGDRGVRYAGVLYGGYRVVTTKTVSLECPTLGLANSVSTDLSPSQGKLNFKWNF